jgi:hypothetical protein
MKVRFNHTQTQSDHSRFTLEAFDTTKLAVYISRIEASTLDLISKGDWFDCNLELVETTSEKYWLVTIDSQFEQAMEQLFAKYNTGHVVPGVGKDAPTVVNEKGGKQSKVLYGMDCLPPKAILDLAKTLEEGRVKYGKDNWRNIEIDSHLNHALIHIFAYMAGDTSDDHLNHATCRLLFALELHLGE